MSVCQVLNNIGKPVQFSCEFSYRFMESVSIGCRDDTRSSSVRSSGVSNAVRFRLGKCSR